MYKNEIHAPSHSRYKVLSADAFTKHGLNPHGVVFDELHAQPTVNFSTCCAHGYGGHVRSRFRDDYNGGLRHAEHLRRTVRVCVQVREGTIIDPGYFVHITGRNGRMTGQTQRCGARRTILGRDGE